MKKVCVPEELDYTRYIKDENAFEDEAYKAWLSDGKLEINSLLWKFLPGKTSLDNSETVAIKIYEIIDEQWNKKNDNSSK